MTKEFDGPIGSWPCSRATENRKNSPENRANKDRGTGEAPRSAFIGGSPHPVPMPEGPENPPPPHLRVWAPEASAPTVIPSPPASVPFVPKPGRSYVFPVKGNVRFRDTWGDPRPGGRFHQGVDIFAPDGTELKAVTDGRIGVLKPKKLSLRLQADDGCTYIYLNLQGYARAMHNGLRVAAGDTIGYLDNLGLLYLLLQAYQGHPKQGGSPRNPYQLLFRLDTYPPEGNPLIHYETIKSYFSAPFSASIDLVPGKHPGKKWSRYYIFPTWRPALFNNDMKKDPKARGVKIFPGYGSSFSIPVFAITDGVVDQIPNVFLLLRGTDKNRYHYVHLQGYAPGIREGLAVKPGQVIGYLGRTGMKSSAAHLHFETRVGGEIQNPYNYLKTLQAKRSGADKPIDISLYPESQ